MTGQRSELDFDSSEIFHKWYLSTSYIIQKLPQRNSYYVHERENAAGSIWLNREHSLFSEILWFLCLVPTASSYLIKAPNMKELNILKNEPDAINSDG